MGQEILLESHPPALHFDSSKKGEDVVLSQDALTAYLGNRGHACFLNRARGSGKFYFELKLVQFEGNEQWGPVVGIATEQTALVNPWLLDSGEVLHYSIPPNNIISIFWNNRRSSYPIKWSQGDVVGYAIDLDAKTMKLHANGVFGLDVSYADVTAHSTFYPIASSSGGATSIHSIVQIVKNPQYCPSGFSLW